MRWLVCVVLLAACGPRVAFLPRDDDVAYAPTAHVEVLFTPPTRAYTEVGLLTVEAKKGNEETMLTKLRQRAQQVGADALLLGHPTTRSDGGNAIAWVPGIVTASSDVTRRLEGLAIRWLAPVATASPGGSDGSQQQSAH